MSDGRTNVQRRADEILAQRLRQIRGQTDRIFAVLFGLQWFFAVGCALTISPRTWIATEFAHAHVWAVIVLGGALALCPIVFAIVRPGAAVTRWVVTIAQMLYSALLIHLLGGRTEAHFHVSDPWQSSRSIAIADCLSRPRSLLLPTTFSADFSGLSPCLVCCCRRRGGPSSTPVGWCLKNCF